MLSWWCRAIIARLLRMAMQATTCATMVRTRLLRKVNDHGTCDPDRRLIGAGGTWAGGLLARYTARRARAGGHAPGCAPGGLLGRSVGPGSGEAIRRRRPSDAHVCRELRD